MSLHLPDTQADRMPAVSTPLGEDALLPEASASTDRSRFAPLAPRRPEAC